ncbi:hypothetical protein X740_28875 [Mesorhizobium sp. LNHC221B00]|uniref:hypothetical protein n=1 Tax=Mesorhizobium sp. LNHC221B00 TaxID=1287233 RepID=UPI0003CF436E|nr:hypothetical protein [Mesorhizobium sp. LNHC221B00]ESY76364.1 hypothetical protein X740_28875 [Mesorhizobium sp. LNHC221B00]
MKSYAAIFAVYVLVGGMSGVVLPGAAAAEDLTSTAGAVTIDHISYLLLDQGGIGAYVKKCPEYDLGDDRTHCLEIHREMIAILEKLSVSRQVDARDFVQRYFTGYFDRLLYCLKTTCDGFFVLKGYAGDDMAQKWARMIAFQACVHAAPATWTATSEKSEAFVPRYRFRDASKGLIPDCDASLLSEADLAILSMFNLSGQY